MAPPAPFPAAAILKAMAVAAGGQTCGRSEHPSPKGACMTSEWPQNLLPRPGKPGPPTRISMPHSYVSANTLQFFYREAGSAVLLLAATLIALVWANLPVGGYEEFWSTAASLQVGSWSATLDLRHLVND